MDPIDNTPIANLPNDDGDVFNTSINSNGHNSNAENISINSHGEDVNCRSDKAGRGFANFKNHDNVFCRKRESNLNIPSDIINSDIELMMRNGNALDCSEANNVMALSESLSNSRESGVCDVSESIHLRRLHISNIPFRFRDNDLRELVAPYGTVLEVEIIFNERGSKGFGFITMSSIDEAENVKRNLNKTNIEGRIVEVNPAVQRAVKRKTDFRYNGSVQKTNQNPSYMPYNLHNSKSNTVFQAQNRVVALPSILNNPQFPHSNLINNFAQSQAQALSNYLITANQQNLIQQQQQQQQNLMIYLLSQPGIVDQLNVGSCMNALPININMLANLNGAMNGLHAPTLIASQPAEIPIISPISTIVANPDAIINGVKYLSHSVLNKRLKYD